MNNTKIQSHRSVQCVQLHEQNQIHVYSDLTFCLQVVDELTHVIESCSSSFYMEECLKAITQLTCKVQYCVACLIDLAWIHRGKGSNELTCSCLQVYQELGPGHKYSDGLQVALQQLLEMLTGLLEHISQSESSGGPSCHPAVVSAFITIIYCRSDLLSSPR